MQGYKRNHDLTSDQPTNHDSSAWRVPKFRMCIFVPAGQLNAGTAADTRREVGSTEEPIFYEVKKEIYQRGKDLRKRLSSVRVVPEEPTMS